MKTTINDTIKVLSLFSGCGGMDLGFEGGFWANKKSINLTIHPDWLIKTKGNQILLPKTRFSTIFANDILDAAQAAWIPYFEKNYKKKNVFVKESIVELVKKAQKGKYQFPNCDIVTGGFPCQDFSVAGLRKGFDSQKNHDGSILNEPSLESRGFLYYWMKQVIELTNPKMFIAENVKGLASLGNVKQIIENDFRNTGAEGYLVFDAKVLNAAHYGVPQSRERVIFIGINKAWLTQKGKKLLEEEKISLYPPETHNEDGTENFLPYVKLNDIFKNLPEPEQSKDLAQQTYSHAKWYGKNCQGNTEISLEKIGPTIRAEHHGNIEFRRLSKEHGGRYIKELAAGKEERRLTVRECARIQTFPDNYEFIRSSQKENNYPLTASKAYKVIGNAVPPILAFNLAWNIQTYWEKLFYE